MQDARLPIRASAWTTKVRQLVVVVKMHCCREAIKATATDSERISSMTLGEAKAATGRRGERPILRLIECRYKILRFVFIGQQFCIARKSIKGGEARSAAHVFQLVKYRGQALHCVRTNTPKENTKRKRLASIQPGIQY